MKRYPYTRLVLPGVALVLVMSLTGCGECDAFTAQDVGLTCSAGVGKPVTLVIGARAKSPKPVLPEKIWGLVREAAKQGKKIQAIRLDGEPTVAFSGTFSTEAKNCEARKSALDSFLRAAQSQIEGIQPKAAEADVLGAITEASRITAQGGTIVVIDSGLQTTGQLRFQDDGMLGVDPAEVVANLEQKNLLPDLSGRCVALVGLGMTAEPQPALDENNRRRVNALWKAVVQKGKSSCVEAIDIGTARESITTDMSVAMVTIPSPPVFRTCGTTVLRDTDNVGFVADKAVFRDEAAARTTLQNLADQIRPGRQKVTLIGTTSSAGDSEEGRVQLSQQRAEAVKKMLVELGIAEDRITAQGKGSHGPNQVPDRGPDGALDPVKAAQNRSVVVELTCP